MTPFAGAIEISGPEMALLLVSAVLIFLGPPIAGALVGRWFYRRKVPPAERKTLHVVRAALLGAVAGVGLLMIVGALSELVD